MSKLEPRAVPFRGFDHLDVRVTEVRKVEPFYDRFFPAIGLSTKKYARVRGDDWTFSDTAFEGYNAVEYHEEGASFTRFCGLIEEPLHRPGLTRIAFRLSSRAEVEEWMARLAHMGALNIEPSDDMDAYPAVFFEDAAGTKLELRARGN